MEITISLATVIIGVIGLIVALIGGFIAFLTFVADRPTRKEMNEALAGERAATESKWQLIKQDLDYIRDRIDSVGGQ